MSIALENKPQLGYGIYTIPDIALILQIPNYKVSRWVTDYWDSRFGLDFNKKYSWSDGKSKAISFHTLIELYTFYQLSKAGVHSSKIIEAHKILTVKFDTPFPFATSQILENISTDGKRIYFEEGDEIIFNIDKTFQLNLRFISDFF